MHLFITIFFLLGLYLRCLWNKYLCKKTSIFSAFVKAGKTTGSVEIDLCNEGPMAYRPNVYGNRINIIRTVSASGSGTYRIRSENGNILEPFS